MAINQKCKYYEKKEFKLNETGYHSYDEQKPVVEHFCTYRVHVEDLPLPFGLEKCDTSHDFCPHNPKKMRI